MKKLLEKLQTYWWYYNSWVYAVGIVFLLLVFLGL